MDRPAFVYVTYIATTPEKLWTALTSGDFTYQYWAQRRIQSEWTPGAVVKTIKDDGTVDWQGKVLAADPPRLLSYTFDVQGDPNRRDVAGKLVEQLDRERPSRVTFQIEEFMGQVKLTLTHDEFEPGSEVLERVSRGWPVVLSGLKSVVEGAGVLFPNWQ
jgi:uncharacterized protein YndB with AHSA1/START domain